MGDVINLRTVRKRKAAVEKSTLAEQNRARFGRTKAQRLADAKERARAERLLDGAERD